MTDDLSRRADDLAFLPSTFREWITRSREATIAGRNWHQYTVLMLAYAEAFSRAPMTAADCERTDIIIHLDREIAFLNATVHYILHKDEEDVVP